MRLFLLMLIVTTIEVILIAKVGALIGFFATFLVIILTAMLGSWLLRKQWHLVIGKLQTLQSEPSQALLEALILVICGVLLITPGFLTDIIGFLGLMPGVRERFVAVLRRHGSGLVRGGVHFSSMGSSFHSHTSASFGSPGSPFGNNGNDGNNRHGNSGGKIIDGEVIDDESERNP